MAGDWIKLHRRLLGSAVMRHDGLFRLWIYCLLRANWEPRNVIVPGGIQQTRLTRGQFITGRRSLHAALYPARDDEGNLIVRDGPVPNESTVWRRLQSLEAAGQLKITSAPKYSVITVCNYSTYQDDAPEVAPKDAQSVHRRCTDDAQMMHRRCTQYKKGRSKEVKKKNKSAHFKPPKLGDVRAYCQERGNSIDPEQFVDHYTANGWRVGGRATMKDWKASIRTWERNQRKPAKSSGSKAVSDEEGRHLDYPATERNVEAGLDEVVYRACDDPACRFGPCLKIRGSA